MTTVTKQERERDRIRFSPGGIQYLDAQLDGIRREVVEKAAEYAEEKHLGRVGKVAIMEVFERVVHDYQMRVEAEAKAERRNGNNS